MKIQEERDDAWDLEEDDEEGGITLESWGMDLEFRIFTLPYFSITTFHFLNSSMEGDFMHFLL